MKLHLKLGAALAIAATSIGLSAHAADAESAWSLGDNDGTAFLYAASPSGPSVTLTCSEKLGVRAIVYLNGNGMDDLALNAKARLVTRNVEIGSDSTEPRDGDWAYFRRAKTLVSTKSWQGKRVFNAAVTGSPVSMDVSRLGSYDITLPAVNDEFKSFVSSCDEI